MSGKSCMCCGEPVVTPVRVSGGEVCVMRVAGGDQRRGQDNMVMVEESVVPVDWSGALLVVVVLKR